MVFMFIVLLTLDHQDIESYSQNCGEDFVFNFLGLGIILVDSYPFKHYCTYFVVTKQIHVKLEKIYTNQNKIFNLFSCSLSAPLSPFRAEYTRMRFSLRRSCPDTEKKY